MEIFTKIILAISTIFLVGTIWFFGSIWEDVSTPNQYGEVGTGSAFVVAFMLAGFLISVMCLALVFDNDKKNGHLKDK